MDPEAIPEESEAPPVHNWQFKRTLPIQDRMADVIRKTIEATEHQLKKERKKLRKLQYGS